MLEDTLKFFKLRYKTSTVKVGVYSFFAKKLYPPNPEQRYLNIGGGNWYYPRWENIDLYALNFFIDHKTDLRLKEPIKFPDGCSKLIFCSHVLEHVSDDVCLFILSECYRLLNQGGVLRISVPDMDKAFEAYNARDNDFFMKAKFVGRGSLESRLVHFFASYSKGDYARGPDVSPGEVRHKFQSLDKYGFVNWCAGLIPKSATYIAHVNGYDFEKLRSLLKKAGFKRIVRSKYMGSSVQMLRGIAFDNKPSISLFVEAYT